MEIDASDHDFLVETSNELQRRVFSSLIATKIDRTRLAQLDQKPVVAQFKKQQLVCFLG